MYNDKWKPVPVPIKWRDTSARRKFSGVTLCTLVVLFLVCWLEITLLFALWGTM